MSSSSIDSRELPGWADRCSIGSSRSGCGAGRRAGDIGGVGERLTLGAVGGGADSSNGALLASAEGGSPGGGKSPAGTGLSEAAPPKTGPRAGCASASGTRASEVVPLTVGEESAPGAQLGVHIDCGSMPTASSFRRSISRRSLLASPTVRDREETVAASPRALGAEPRGFGANMITSARPCSVALEARGPLSSPAKFGSGDSAATGPEVGASGLPGTGELGLGRGALSQSSTPASPLLC